MEIEPEPPYIRPKLDDSLSKRYQGFRGGLINTGGALREFAIADWQLLSPKERKIIGVTSISLIAFITLGCIIAKNRFTKP